MDQAIKHCTAGIGIWEWASNDQGGEPDVVMACCGDVPTLETLAAVDLLRQHAPELKVRVVNVVDLMKLQPPSEHPHGLSDHDFDALFTTDKPVIFAFHGYPWLIHRLTYRRTNHDNLHVRGYKEEGTTTTPFDMCVLNDLDRFHLVERRDRPRAAARRARRLRQAGDPRQADRAQAVHRPARRRHARDRRLDLGRSQDGRRHPLDRSRQRLSRRAALNLFVLRHGETAWSLTGQHTGLTDLPLTDNGRRRAAKLRPVLAKETFTLVLVSPLQRARQTCELAGLGEEAVVDPDLAEWNYGAYEGLTSAQIHETAPGWLIFRDGCPGGEAPPQVAARVDRVIARARAVEGDVALFAHGHVLRVLATRWLGLPMLAGQQFLLDPATSSVLGDAGEVAVVRVWNGSPPA